LFGRITDIVAGKASLSPLDLLQLEERLLLADVGVAAAERLLSSLKRTDGKLPAIDTLKNEMRSILSTNFDFRISNFEFETKPQVWLIAGVNGSGKTTTIGKLGHRFRDEGKKVMLAAADT